MYVGTVQSRAHRINGIALPGVARFFRRMKVRMPALNCLYVLFHRVHLWVC